MLKKECGVASASTPKTPRKISAGVVKTPSSKRSVASIGKVDSESKRRKVAGSGNRNGNGKKKAGQSKKKKGMDDEDSEEEVELTSSADDGDGEDVDDDEESEEGEEMPSPTPARRNLPARTRVRNVSYVAEADSAGEDAGAKESCSDDDETFSPHLMEQGKGKAKLKMGALDRKDDVGKEGNEGQKVQAGGMSARENEDDDTGYESEEDSYAETFYTVPDYVV